MDEPNPTTKRAKQTKTKTTRAKRQKVSEMKDAMEVEETAEVTTVMNETERHGGQEISTSVNNMEVEGATKQMVEHWDVTKLTSWLNKACRCILKT